MTIMNQNVVSWADDLYEKFVAFRVEVEENMYQGPVKYVEDQVKTVGDCVKKFCSDVMKDFENLADDEISDKSEAKIKKEPATIETNQLDKKGSFIKKLYSEVKEDLSDLADHGISEESQANINEVNVKVDSSVIPHVESENADNRLSSRIRRVRNAELSDLHLDRNDHAELDLSEKYDAETKVFQSEILVHRESHASDLSQTSIGGRSNESTGDEIEGDHATDDAVEIYDQHSMTKLGESCVLVDKSEELSVSDLQDQQRSYKKKMKDVLYPRSWVMSRKLAICPERMEAGATSQGELQGKDSVESGWELV